MSRNSDALGAFSRRLRWFGAFLSLCLVMSALVPAPAAAVNGLADLTVGATTVDPHTGFGHVTLNVTCVVPASAVSARMVTTQASGQGRQAYSFDLGGVLTGCQAGQRISVVMSFGRPEAYGGKFGPGPATIEGYAVTFGTAIEDTGFVRFGPMTVVLRPER